ncbi:hypothetical protein UVI_02033480 [Ustilaginoidea virens]|nr:hypothetical protein UVI_02033480 [Ustilaginoidea virens]
MLYYARSDTHYLLYIFDHVRNELIEASDRTQPETDLIKQALDRSRELSLSRHQHPDCNEATGEGPRGWYNYMLKNSHLNFDEKQFAVFKALWKWRDETARQEDESPNFVLGTSNVTEIARVNPPDVKALHSLLPLSAPLARARLNDVWNRVLDAKAEAGPSLLQYFASMAPETVTKDRLSRLPNETVRLPHLEGTRLVVPKMTQSKLFGSMAVSSLWEESKKLSAELGGNIPFPWQRFVQDSATALGDAHTESVAGQVIEEPSSTLETRKTAVAVTLEDQDEEFTLKAGRKRKQEQEPEPDQEDTTSSSGEYELEPKSSTDENVPLTGADGTLSIVDKPRRAKKKQGRSERRLREEQQETELANKREAKLARKAKKQEHRARVAKEQEKKYSAVPFDYSTAPTVMHASRNNTVGKESRKVFDPYTKTADEGIKGARKMPPVRGEKSATFRK